MISVTDNEPEDVPQYLSLLVTSPLPMVFSENPVVTTQNRKSFFTTKRNYLDISSSDNEIGLSKEKHFVETFLSNQCRDKKRRDYVGFNPFGNDFDQQTELEIDLVDDQIIFNLSFYNRLHYCHYIREISRERNKNKSSSIINQYGIIIKSLPTLSGVRQQPVDVVVHRSLSWQEEEEELPFRKTFCSLPTSISCHSTSIQSTAMNQGSNDLNNITINQTIKNMDLITSLNRWQITNSYLLFSMNIISYLISHLTEFRLSYKYTENKFHHFFKLPNISTCIQNNHHFRRSRIRLNIKSRNNSGLMKNKELKCPCTRRDQREKSLNGKYELNLLIHKMDLSKKSTIFQYNCSNEQLNKQRLYYNHVVENDLSCWSYDHQGSGKCLYQSLASETDTEKPFKVLYLLNKVEEKENKYQNSRSTTLTVVPINNFIQSDLYSENNLNLDRNMSVSYKLCIRNKKYVNNFDEINRRTFGLNSRNSQRISEEFDESVKIRQMTNSSIKIKDHAVANKNESQSTSVDEKCSLLKKMKIRANRYTTKESFPITKNTMIKSQENEWKGHLGRKTFATSSLVLKGKIFSPAACFFFVWIFVWKVLLLSAIRADCRRRFNDKKVNKKILPDSSKRWKKMKTKVSSPMRQSWRFLFLLFTMIASADAVCPRSCACKWKGGKQTVECINKGLMTIPSDMDPGTQVLDMTGNSLVIISKDNFKIIGLTNLQRIYATRCKLARLDDSAFRGLTNLVELDLSHNELNVVPAASFLHLPSLMRLQLSYNPITLIKDGSFKGLNYLTSLEMTSCNIEKVEAMAFQGLDRLEWLKINSNNLTTVPSAILLPKSLHGVDIHNNPWRCDCNLRQLRQWLVQYNVPSSIEPKCKSPARMRNRIIKDIIPMELACAPVIRPTSLFLDVMVGKNVSLECRVKATPEAEITWKFNNFPLENSSFAYDETTSLYVFEDRDLRDEKISHLRIEMVNEAHSGLFQCIAENEADRAMSNFTLGVNPQPTRPAPEKPVKDNMIFVVGALIVGVVFICIVLCVMIAKCCGHKRSLKKSEVCKAGVSKDNYKPKVNNMPKYIQMGKPAPKLNGILVDTPPISVIENSPYRNERLGSTNINPDLISDGPDDRAKPVKKKVCIAGVEEMDASGNRVTRKLDDIIEEESEEVSHFDINKFEPQNYDPNYAPLTNGRIDVTGQYSIVAISPEQQLPHTHGYYDIRGFPRDAVLVDSTKRYSPVPPSDQTSLYASLRRPRQTPSPLLVSDQKYPDNYNHGSPYTTTESRYPQSKMHEGNHSFYECCQPIPQSLSADYGSREPLGRIRGDGCSFDNILSSCGGQCCYNENHPHHIHPQHQVFDNTLPENYRPLDDPPPPPPAGYGDSEDEVDEEVKTNWENEVTLSPGTRILYSPKESNYGDTLVDNNAVTNV